MATIAMHRIFRFGATDLPDPDEGGSPQEVLDHYANTFPQLKYGKVSEGEAIGDAYVYELKTNGFKPNG